MKLRNWAFVVAVMLLGGCSTSSEQSTDSPDGPLTGVDVSNGSPAQAEEISDREATADEYQAAFQRFRECMSAAGFELEDVEFANFVYEFGIPNAAVEDGTDAECYQAEFQYVDMLWQSTEEVQNSSDAAQFLRECLQEHDIEPAGTLREMSDQLREAGIEPSECPQ